MGNGHWASAGHTRVPGRGCIRKDVPRERSVRDARGILKGVPPFAVELWCQRQITSRAQRRKGKHTREHDGRKDRVNLHLRAVHLSLSLRVSTAGLAWMQHVVEVNVFEIRFDKSSFEFR